MTDTTSPERHPTDEPDGTTAHEASLRPPGGSLSPVSSDDGSSAGTEDFDEPRSEETDTSDVSGAGYDVESVSGDTEAYRPD
jgi:hypothetical protein